MRASRALRRGTASSQSLAKTWARRWRGLAGEYARVDPGRQRSPWRCAASRFRSACSAVDAEAKVRKTSAVAANLAAKAAVAKSVAAKAAALNAAAASGRDWWQLDDDQRRAWVVLGWCEKSWSSRVPPPPTSRRRWRELTITEQAAATHGLRCTPEVWDERLRDAAATQDHLSAVGFGVDATLPDGLRMKPFVASTRCDGSLAHAARVAVRHVAAARTCVSDFGVALVGAAVHLVAAAALRLGVVLPLTAEAQKVTTAFQLERSSGLVSVDEFENLVYLDDSDSMNGDHFFEARKAFLRLTRELGSSPTRVVKFGTRPAVLLQRGTESAVLATAAEWDGTSGGTYLWKMIEDDVFAQYRPGTGRLRVVIITDGMDELSPRAYRGLRGMDIMMKNLRDAGFDLEFYVVVVGSLARAPGASERYAGLAGATGGAFLGLAGHFDSRRGETRAFLAALRQSSTALDDNASGRRQRRLAHRAEEQRRLESSGVRGMSRWRI